MEAGYAWLRSNGGAAVMKTSKIWAWVTAFVTEPRVAWFVNGSLFAYGTTALRDREYLLWAFNHGLLALQLIVWQIRRRHGA